MTDKPNKIKGWIRVLIILLPYLFILGIFQIIAFLILGISITDRTAQTTTFQTMIISLFNLAGTILTIAIFRKYIDQKSFRSIGLSFSKDFKLHLLIGIGLGAAIQGIGFIVLLRSGSIQWASTNVNIPNLIYSLILFVSVAFIEEMFSRGYILNNLMESMSRFVALFISAALFSVLHIFNAHFSWFNFFSILLAGILLGLPYIYNKNLWLPIALHFSWNFFQGPILGFNVSGNVIYSLIVQSRTEDNMLNGGEFGFEGSALCVALQVIAIIFMGYFFHKKEKMRLQKQEEKALQDSIFN